MFPSSPSFTCAIKTLAGGSHFCFLTSPISVLQSNSSGTGNLFTSHSFNCLIICSNAMMKSSNILLSPQPSPAWKKSMQSVLLRCGLFSYFFVNPNYSYSSEMFCKMVREGHGPFQSYVSSVSSQWSSVLFFGIYWCNITFGFVTPASENARMLDPWRCRKGQCTCVPWEKTSWVSCCCVANLPCLHPLNSGYCMQA